MIRLIEALNFRCLRYISQPLGPFHILVGPNASGKTTFLDVIAFLGKLVSEGLDTAISERTNNFSDLVWRHEAKYIELSIEAVIPEIQRKRLWNPENDTIRYEVRIGITSDTSEVGVLEERVIVKRGGEKRRPPQLLFPMEPDPPSSILNPRAKKGERTIVGRSQGKRNVNFNSEVEQETGKGWVWSLHLKPQKSALANLPEDESKFPVSTWFKDLLIRQVQSLVLNSLAIRRASPPGQGYGFKPDGSNMTALPGLKKTGVECR